ncbi:hypothetical protein [Leptospira noguchii]|uniref:Uncharacterized protein n=1 Tax=Leptospira noguchii TaxID=28182 RepID=A0AAE9KA78_9LEPT|nr:hypothetical protein [Leptospira noguchii]UOG57676.1 hypothetical protein MAL03_05975 [Leptospira noguchii]
MPIFREAFAEFLGSRLKLKHNALYGSRWKLNTTLSMDRVGNSTQRSL